MITENEAEAIAGAVLGRQKDDPDRPWSLEEFTQGWLINEEPPSGELFFGAASLVIERETAQVRRFPSSVPPDRITGEYPAVRDRGHDIQRES